MDDDTLSSGEMAERRGSTGRPGQGGGPSAEPDVLLDVPQLRVDEIILDVEDLRAHVSVQADVLNLLRLSVGADVRLGGVHLEIRGVEAQALLKVRLDKVAEIIDRVLSTIDSNPEIVDRIVPPLGAAISDLERTAGRSVGEVAGAVGSAPLDVDNSIAETIGEPGGIDAIAEEEVPADEQAAAEASQYEAEPVEDDEGMPGDLRRSPKQERTAEEAPP